MKRLFVLVLFLLAACAPEGTNSSVVTHPQKTNDGVVVFSNGEYSVTRFFDAPAGKICYLATQDLALTAPSLFCFTDESR